MFYVYILECVDGSYYTGSAHDIIQRYIIHQMGKGAKYTQFRRPLVIRYIEVHHEWGLALRREREIKKLKKNKKHKLIQDLNFHRIPQNK